MEKRFLLVDAAVLPEVFVRVLQAKELLASRRARNISAAVKMAGLSRSAFYKYKDCVYDAQDSAEVTTVHATLRDETGALHSLLEAISGAGASIVTINQSTPESGTARVSVLVPHRRHALFGRGAAGRAAPSAHGGGYPARRLTGV